MKRLRLSQAVEDFLIAIEADGLSPRTIEDYGRNLRFLIAFLGDPPLRRISAEDLRRFLADFRRERGPKTTYNAWAAIRSFWRYLESRGFENPTRALRAPRDPRPLIRVPTPADIRRVLEACERTAPSQGRRRSFRMRRPTALRDRALVLLLVDTGLRIGEVPALRVEDVDLNSGRIRVWRGKGGKGRVVFASPPVLEALRAYWASRSAKPEDPAFADLDGRGLSAEALKRLIRRLGRRAGVRIHAHALRHFFATPYLRNGGDPLTLKRLLGQGTMPTNRPAFAPGGARPAVSGHKGTECPLTARRLVGIGRPSRRGGARPAGDAFERWGC